MKKRVISALLAACLACSVFATAVVVNAAQPTSSEPSASSTVEETSTAPAENTQADQTASESTSSAPAENTASSAPTENTASSAPAENTDTDQAASESASSAPSETPAGDATYTASAKNQDGQSVNVIVDVPEGAFADGVKPVLHAKAITDKTELDKTADALKQKDDTSFDGMVALDVYFTNGSNTEEIEPAKQVSVRFEMPQTALPDDIDPSTLTVHHLDETGGAVDAQTVATTDTKDSVKGIIALSDEAAAQTKAAADVARLSKLSSVPATVEQSIQDPAVVAEFDVKSFSTFTITWNNYFKVTVHYVDEAGEEIQGTHTTDEFISNNNNNNSKNFSDYADEIDGYTYQGAHYKSATGEVVTSMQAATQQYGGRYPTRYLTFYNGTTQVGRLQYSNNTQTQTADVYLVYQKNDTSGGGGSGTGGGTVTQNATVTTGKTAVRRDDGNYDLTLSISGTRGSASSPAPVDVLFIVDKSASMTDNNSPRLKNAKTAMKTLVNSLESNKNINAQYSIVTFSGPSRAGNSNGKRDASVKMNWTSVSGNNVENSIDGIRASGGTDYQAGLDVGTDQLNSARPGAVKVVIFLSDGEPTWSYDYGQGNKALDRTWSWDWSSSTYQGWVDTLNQAKKISCDYFYAIGIGSSSNNYLNDLVTNVKATTKQRIEAADDGSNLTNLFSNIAANVSFFAAQNVTITDPLSQYADLVLTNNAPQFTISITNGTQTWSNTVAAGESVKFYDANNHPQTATARVSSDNRTIYLDLPATYQLEQGYTYSISTVITPSQAAKDAGMNSDAAKQTPDDHTGTHSETNPKQQGFWSNDNDNAKVTYTANGESGSENFPKPVIQVSEEPHTLTISKEVSGNGGDKTKDFQFSLTVLPEQGGTPLTSDAYQKIAETAKRTNPPSDEGDRTEDSTFSGLSFNESGTASFTLHDGQNVTIQIPDGYYCQVGETKESYSSKVSVTDNAWNTNDAIVSGTLTDDTTVAYTNSLVIDTPTGIEDNHTPYVVMVTATALAGSALIGGVVARHFRRRRREE